MKVGVLHLDLGIGGAEQLIVNIASSLKESGHEVFVLTSHHDENHCFEETKNFGFFLCLITLFFFFIIIFTY
jgi:hypothetical protein